MEALLKSENGHDIFAATCASKQKALIYGSSGIPTTHVAGRLSVTMNYSVKWIVPVILGAIALVKHDAEAVWFVVGSLLNLLLSVTLKQTLKQERPSSSISSGHGMPSTHAQSIFFVAVVTIVSTVEWHGLNAATTIVGGLVLAFGSYLSWLRVSLRYHTLSQVSMGAMVGSTFSIFWFWVWNAFVSKAFISSVLVGIIVVLGAFGSTVAFLLLVTFIAG